jgi:hypothetical protein
MAQLVEQHLAELSAPLGMTEPGGKHDHPAGKPDAERAEPAGAHEYLGHGSGLRLRHQLQHPPGCRVCAPEQETQMDAPGQEVRGADADPQEVEGQEPGDAVPLCGANPDCTGNECTARAATEKGNLGWIARVLQELADFVPE